MSPECVQRCSICCYTHILYLAVEPARYRAGTIVHADGLWTMRSYGRIIQALLYKNLEVR